MTSERKCEHVRCFSKSMLMSFPPQRPWICELCGAEGTDDMEMSVDLGRYDELKRKKKAGGFDES